MSTVLKGYHTIGIRRFDPEAAELQGTYFGQDPPTFGPSDTAIGLRSLFNRYALSMHLYERSIIHGLRTRSSLKIVKKEKIRITMAAPDAMLITSNFDHKIIIPLQSQSLCCLILLLPRTGTNFISRLYTIAKNLHVRRWNLFQQS